MSGKLADSDQLSADVSGLLAVRHTGAVISLIFEARCFALVASAFKPLAEFFYESGMIFVFASVCGAVQSDNTQRLRGYF